MCEVLFVSNDNDGELPLMPVMTMMLPIVSPSDDLVTGARAPRNHGMAATMLMQKSSYPTSS